MAWISRQIWWILLGLLAADFLIPRHWLVDAHLDLQAIQMGLCAIVGVYLTGQYLSRRQPARDIASVAKCFLVSVAAVLAYLAVLEAAQLLTPDRHARVVDFLRNSTTVLAICGLSFLAIVAGILFDHADQRAHDDILEEDRW